MKAINVDEVSEHGPCGLGLYSDVSADGYDGHDNASQALVKFNSWGFS
jgi:hypothetical protein